jgi:ATP/maltotriose-dependent transcriptional regulator MalT
LQAYGREFKNFRPGSRQNYEDIFNYFAKDIFESLDIQTREFLLNTAILEDFNSKICD